MAHYRCLAEDAMSKGLSPDMFLVIFLTGALRTFGGEVTQDALQRAESYMEHLRQNETIDWSFVMGYLAGFDSGQSSVLAMRPQS